MSSSLRGCQRGPAKAPPPAPRLPTIVPPVPVPLPAAALLLAGLAIGCEDGTPDPVLPAPAPPIPSDTVPSAVTEWLDASAHPFDGPHLSLPPDDIRFLRDLVGDARIVALGENTHGARDFFEMKARILRFLVEEMDFDAFAIEATFPESRRLDRYVRTGEGNPREFLSGLYFWTWNTESVLEMIEWMRAHNEAGGDLGFHGFDMQFPGMALHNVRQYIEGVAPERAEAVAEGLHCLELFANSPTGRFPEIRYRDQTDEYREVCGESLEEVRTELVGNRAEYEAVEGPDAFALALQNLRVAFQHHLRASGGQSRDESMAENTVWIRDQLGPESRMVLWAHNFHVSTQPGAQGAYLRETFGDEMVVVGVSQEGGRFTARDFREESRPLLEFELEPPLTDSFEHFLSRATAPRFVLDLRGVDASAAGSSWLAGLRPFRSIGCCVISSLDDPSWQWTDTPLTEWYDVIIHFESTRATTLLPRNPPFVW